MRYLNNFDRNYTISYLNKHSIRVHLRERCEEIYVSDKVAMSIPWLLNNKYDSLLKQIIAVVERDFPELLL